MCATHDILSSGPARAMRARAHSETGGHDTDEWIALESCSISVIATWR